MGVEPITVPRSLVAALNSAGQKSGVDFGYLLQTALRESSLNPNAKASTSSATGLFQFIESTWLEVMKTEGPRLGYAQYASQITETAGGDFVVGDARARQALLKLREDPVIAADLAAAYTRTNGEYLHARFARMPSAGELYIAHFLGARGAETMFNAGLSDPNQLAAPLFPRQAKANPSIFYAGGKARTVREVYQVLVARHEGLAASPMQASFAAQQLASEPRVEALPSRFGPGDMSFTSLFSTDAAPPTGRVLLTPEPVPEAAFFTQLYGK